ncbi:MAG: Smr/MutS family protein [Saprospiraceae bacterium]|nr:Smr/MutS family protein [Saprospiraceae bacterium]
MIDINDLWIGDLLLLKKSGRIGKFDGRSGHKKVRVKIGNKIVISPITNIEMAPESSETTPDIFSLRPEKKIVKSSSFSDQIDLHIEVLNPSLKHARVERIVDFQVKAAKKFIEESIASNTKQVLIIHGKGEGVLKLEIAHLLSLYDEVQFTFEKNNGGATEVWFK